MIFADSGECSVALKEDLQEAVTKIFKGQWTQRDGEVVPEPKDLGLGNDAANLEATVLYADMAGSTQLVDSQKAHLAAEVYKTYMICAARIIKNNGGAITAYDFFACNSKHSVGGGAQLPLLGCACAIKPHAQNH